MVAQILSTVGIMVAFSVDTIIEEIDIIIFWLASRFPRRQCAIKGVRCTSHICSYSLFKFPVMVATQTQNITVLEWGSPCPRRSIHLLTYILCSINICSILSSGPELDKGASRPNWAYSSVPLQATLEGFSYMEPSLCSMKHFVIFLTAFPPGNGRP